MGGGASTVGELTVEQKAEISREIQARYAQTAMSSDTATISDIEVYKTLADVYQAEIDKFKSITSSSESGNAKDVNLGLDEMLDGPVVLVRSDTDLSTKSNRSNSGGVAIDQHIDHDFDHEDPMVRAKTSQDLLSECQEAHDQNAKISSFINQLKDGDISTTRTSRFRIRRLTYSQRTLEVSESASPISKQQARRTTIYASTEIGVRQEKVPPFPDNYLGTFSCHGIEPSDDDEGVHDKINQDRGCVVYPYNSSMETALFMALDGHGEQGDAVSEFVMKQIVVSLEKHPGLLDDPVLALTETFVKTNIALMATNISYMTSGCTCVCAYVVGEKLYVANCGDSRAVMAVGSSFSNLKAKNLSRDHKPDDPEEAKRITEWGGYILPAPEPGLTARVYLDPQFTMIGLAMARSLGRCLLFYLSIYQSFRDISSHNSHFSSLATYIRRFRCQERRCYCRA